MNGANIKANNLVCLYNKKFKGYEMTTKQQIKVMQKYLDGEIIQRSEISSIVETWADTNPTWNWLRYNYRVKPKKVEMLYEWWYKMSIDPSFSISTYLKTESKAYDSYHHGLYGKTGRYFNPETKEFGYDK